MLAQIAKNRDSFISLFCLIDDLCNALLPKNIGSTAGRKPKLSTSELITIAVIFSLTDQNTFKGFYYLLKMWSDFDLPDYSNLLKNIKSVSYSTVIMLHLITSINRQLDTDKLIKFIDSTPLPVCGNKRIFGYKVTDFVGRGRSTMGWFYGFKLHVIIDAEGKLLRFEFTAGNVSDKNRELVLKMFDGIKGIAVGDKGYLSKDLAAELAKLGIIFETGVRKGMKVLATKSYHYRQRLRQLVETAIGQIKFRKACASTLPRSLDGYFWRYASAVFAYVLLTQLI